LSQIILSSGWGPSNLRQNGQKPAPLMTSPIKKRNPNFFFIAN